MAFAEYSVQLINFHPCWFASALDGRYLVNSLVEVFAVFGFNGHYGQLVDSTIAVSSKVLEGACSIGVRCCGWFTLTTLFSAEDSLN
jgi:hypothetical protein